MPPFGVLPVYCIWRVVCLAHKGRVQRTPTSHVSEGQLLMADWFAMMFSVGDLFLAQYVQDSSKMYVFQRLGHVSPVGRKA